MGGGKKAGLRTHCAIPDFNMWYSNECSHALHQRNETKIFSYVVQNFFYIKHHKSWTDLLYLNSKKLPIEWCWDSVLCFAFRQCCCLKVDTRHNILKQSQQARSSKWIWAFFRCQSWGCCNIPHQNV